MTPDDFVLSFVNLYRNARKLTVPGHQITRARARSVSSELEELVAAYVLAHAQHDLHVYVDQPVSLGARKVAYPDLVVLDKASNTVVSIVDVKTDIGWNRKGLGNICKKLSNIRTGLKNQGTIKLGPEPSLRTAYAVSPHLTCHIVVGALDNSGKALNTPEATMLAKQSEVQLYLLTSGKHPNHFSRTHDQQFPEMEIRRPAFDAMARGIGAAQLR